MNLWEIVVQMIPHMVHSVQCLRTVECRECGVGGAREGKGGETMVICKMKKTF